MCDPERSVRCRNSERTKSYWRRDEVVAGAMADDSPARLCDDDLAGYLDLGRRGVERRRGIRPLDREREVGSSRGCKRVIG